MKIIDSVVFSPAVEGTRTVTFMLHNRGLVDVDLPAYTLHWALTLCGVGSTLGESELAKPVLAPETK